jgi:hypothetical protein
LSRFGRMGHPGFSPPMLARLARIGNEAGRGDDAAPA